jgi:hypothetical protein
MPPIFALDRMPGDLPRLPPQCLKYLTYNILYQIHSTRAAESFRSDSSLMPVELSIVVTPTFNRIFVLSAAKYEMPDS